MQFLQIYNIQLPKLSQNLQVVVKEILSKLREGWVQKKRENTDIARISLTPPPPPNPGTLVDSMTKVRKYELRDFDDKSA